MITRILRNHFVLSHAILAGCCSCADLVSDWNRIGAGSLAQNPPKHQERGLAMMHLAQFDADNLDLAVRAPSSTPIGRWRPTPLALAPDVSAELRYPSPFTMTTIAQFRQGPPPALTSAQYAADYNDTTPGDPSWTSFDPEPRSGTYSCHPILQ